MAMKIGVILLLSLFVVCSTFAVGLAKDPKSERECERWCKQQGRYEETREREWCLKECKQQRGRDQSDDIQEEYTSWMLMTDPKTRLKRCQQKCENHPVEERERCRYVCQEKYKTTTEKEEREGGRGSQDEESSNDTVEVREAHEQENPYTFQEQHFTAQGKSEHGRVRVLQRFDKNSKLLQGLAYYRVSILEADPYTFIPTTHFDADIIVFVARGEAAITMFLGGDKKQTFRLERGHIIRIPAGTPVHLVNRHENEKLVIVNLISPVNLPGKYKSYHSAGGENPESFFRAFSWELLEAALKTDRGRLEKIFQQRKGTILKASKQQIEALSQEESGSESIWPFSGESSNRPFNLLNQTPVRSNHFGQLFEANPEDYKQLRDLELSVSLGNITQGAMAGPFFNSKATKISIVLDGEGYFEMACPHLSKSAQSSEERMRKRSEGKREVKSAQYQKVRSDVRRGTVFIVPAGHPVAVVASGNSNLKMVCFEINARGNRKYELAGRRNYLKAMEREAKELGFGVGARDVDDVFGKQDLEFFFPGPGAEGGRRADA